MNVAGKVLFRVQFQSRPQRSPIQNVKIGTCFQKEKENKQKKILWIYGQSQMPFMVVQAFNPGTWEGEAGRSL